jgi:protein gp37
MKTKIEWTIRPRAGDSSFMPGYTFNPWWGCEHALGASDPEDPSDTDATSPACDNCYAEAFAKRVGHGETWQEGGERRFFPDAHWNDVLKWQAFAKELGEQHLVFCGSMCDVGEEREILRPHQARVFKLAEDTPNLIWLFLTKRPDSLRRIVPWKDAWPENTWFGVTVEKRGYLWRVEEALKADVPVHFVSYEPALGDVDFRPFLGAQRGKVQWLIFGTESGGRARVVPHERGEAVIAQCEETGAAPFIKQLDSGLLQIGRRGQAHKEMSGFPDRLRVRRWPVIGGAR